MKRFVSVIIAIIIFLIPFSLKAKNVNTYNKEYLKKIADDIIKWKKSELKSTDNLINEKYLVNAGTTAGDWFQIGMSRLSVEGDYQAYLSVIKDIVLNDYNEDDSQFQKATDLHRISLAILSCGGDPTNVGVDKNGNIINIIKDGVYDRGKIASLGKQGINGWIWGLITADSKGYAFPDNSFYTRDDIITEIVKLQLSDGGFNLSGDTSDIDITAMAIQSLAPYYNSEKIYEYNQKALKKTVKKTVKDVIDEAVLTLSSRQTGDGDYKSWGTQNCESTCQVVVALCSLGINPLEDERFIKDGNTLVDGILKYKMSDGGFIHSFNYDRNNPSSHPDKSNSMASEQVLYTLASLIRNIDNKRALYDFRKEKSNLLDEKIINIQTEINNLNKSSDANTITMILKEYYSIKEDERRYVNNYWSLSSYAKAKNIDILKLENETSIIDFDEDENEDNPFVFTEEDDKLYKALPLVPTTKEYVTVLKLLNVLNNCENFKNKEQYLKKLNEYKDKIIIIQKEINSLNNEIKKKLYPFEKISLKDKKTVDKIVKRYDNLNEYDKSKIEHYQDVIKTKTKLDNELRALIIKLFCACLVIILTLIIVKRIKKRINDKKNPVGELIVKYEDEE